MKMRSFRYLVREGCKNVWVNRLMSVASVGVLLACMVIIGLAILITENVNVALGNLEKQNVVMVYMKDYNWALYSDNKNDGAAKAGEPDENGIYDTDYVIHSEADAKALCNKIGNLSNVQKVEYISSESGLESIKETMLDGQEEYFSFLNDKYGNPMSAAAKVTMENMDKFDDTLKEISKLDGVDVIQSQGDLADKISAIKKGVFIAGIWIIAILVIISLVIVSNTIKVTMFNRKLEISIMKAVGATDSFVRLPFVVEGVLIGIISALLAEGVLYFCYRVATEKIISTLGTTDVVRYSEVALLLLGVFVLIGILAGAIGSFLTISKYLKHEGSEFSAY